MNGMMCKLWWTENGDGVGGVDVMVKELCEVVKIRIASDSDGSCVGF